MKGFQRGISIDNGHKYSSFSVWQHLLLILRWNESINNKFILLCSSFSLLWGPVNHVKHLCSLGRLPFTAAYFGSMFATLYMAMIVSTRILNLFLSPMIKCFYLGFFTFVLLKQNAVATNCKSLGFIAVWAPTKGYVQGRLVLMRGHCAQAPSLTRA